MVAFVVVIAMQLVTKHTGYRYATYSDVMLYLAYGLLCFVIAQTLRRTSHLRHLAIAVSAFGFTIALLLSCRALVLGQVVLAHHAA